jgi:CheY-like chemotaxis protein
MHEMPEILAVDDHPAVRQGLALVLKEEGVGACCEAGGLEEALDVARRESPDMVLVDLNMGDEDAMALMAELRQMRIPGPGLLDERDAVAGETGDGSRCTRVHHQGRGAGDRASRPQRPRRMDADQPVCCGGVA